MSELAFYTLILRPTTLIDGINISPDIINFDGVRPMFPRETRSNTVIVEAITLDAVLQLYGAGRLSAMRHIGGMHGLIVPRCQVTDLATGATTAAFVLAKDSRSINGCYLM